MLDSMEARLSYWVDLRPYWDNNTYAAFFPDGINDLSPDALAVGWLGYAVLAPFVAIVFLVSTVGTIVIIGVWIWICWTDCHKTTRETRQPLVGQQETAFASIFYIVAGYGILFFTWSFAARASWNVLFPERASLPLSISAILACIPGTVWLWKAVRPAGYSGKGRARGGYGAISSDDEMGA
ncbi:uncharacterized protein LOC129599248 [Paramacrobiotus metropolitanus]|uniref:uncharacterized protein LOC129599248 n=1 Tax=Paramacrobiotus metropolitanus TaxID=2943436 RepID=UPI002445D481|nr:uncharacterized protein LOC129599248 [Paramacrobiotus metropolitanus]